VQRKTLRQVLHDVDPGLNIVSGGTRRKRPRVSDREWLASAGVICAICGKEAFQSREGLCMPCWEKREDGKVTIIDKTGLSEFIPLELLSSLAKKAKDG
jgi:hypothetical protein